VLLISTQPSLRILSSMHSQDKLNIEKEDKNVSVKR
jgi:hypothetical protein